MRNYQVKDIMQRKNMTTFDVVEKSKGKLTYSMVVNQLSRRTTNINVEHIKGWVNALELTPEQIYSIFFE